MKGIRNIHSKAWTHVLRYAVGPGALVPYDELKEGYGEGMCDKEFTQFLLEIIEGKDLELVEEK